MPKKSPRESSQDGGRERKQYNIGLTMADAERVDRTAEKLGLDPTQFLRMVIRENLKRYEKRAAEIDEDSDAQP